MMKQSAMYGKAALVLAVGALLLSGCSGGETGSETADSTPGQFDNLDDLYEAAVDAGQTTITVYGPAEANFQPAYDAFTEAYPEITVKSEAIFGAELRTRLDQESVTGKHVADLVHLEDAATLASEDRLQSVEPFTATDVTDDALRMDNQLISPTYSPFGLVYNTDSVIDPPQDWDDLLDPQWRGRLGMGDPTTINGTTNALTAAVEAGVIDEEYLTALAAQEPVQYANNSELGTAVATGQSDIGIIFPSLFYKVSLDKGLPLGLVFPLESGSYMTAFPYGMLKDSPSPLATELLLNWMFTDDAQSFAPAMMVYGTVNTTPPPEGLPPLADATTFSTPPEDAAELQEKWIPVFTEIFS